MGYEKVPSGWSAVRSVDVFCFPMTGQRFGVGLRIHVRKDRSFDFHPLVLDAPVACALFPGMAAAGRDYADLVVSEIER